MKGYSSFKIDFVLKALRYTDYCLGEDARAELVQVSTVGYNPGTYIVINVAFDLPVDSKGRKNISDRLEEGASEIASSYRWIGREDRAEGPFFPPPYYGQTKWKGKEEKSAEGIEIVFHYTTNTCLWQLALESL